MKGWVLVRRVLAFVFGGLAVVCFCLSVFAMGQPAGEGEVSVILHGGFIMLGLIAALVFGLIAAWLALWHYRVLRYGGMLLALGGVLFLTVGPLIQREIWARRYAASEARAELYNATFLSFLDQLGAAEGDADRARALHGAYMDEMHSGELRGYTERSDWDHFGYVHYIFMRVIFDEVEPVQGGLERSRFGPPPYSGLYFCYTFYEHYDHLLTSPEREARAAAVCDR